MQTSTWSISETRTANRHGTCPCWDDSDARVSLLFVSCRMYVRTKRDLGAPVRAIESVVLSRRWHRSSFMISVYGEFHETWLAQRRPLGGSCCPTDFACLGVLPPIYSDLLMSSDSVVRCSEGTFGHKRGRGTWRSAVRAGRRRGI